MIAELAPYPEYRDSGVSWPGEVPRDWKVQRLKVAFDQILGGATPASGTAEYWDGDVPWATPTDVSRANLLEKTERTLTLEGLRACSAGVVPPGSIIVTCRAPVGNLAVAGVSLATNQGCKALIPNANLNSQYAFLMLGVLAGEMRSWAVGTTFPEISTGRTGSLLMCVPPKADQISIVRYLDYVDSRIQRLIAAKERLIELLEEEKQAIIHRAVTRGLDPDVRLRQSGVEAIGEIPSHWEVLPFKRVLGFREGPGIGAADFRDQGTPLVRIAGLKGVVASLDGCNFLDPEQVEKRWTQFKIERQDYLLSASASAGEVVPASEEVLGAIPYTGIIRLWPLRDTTHMPFVSHFLRSRPFRNQVDVMASGVAIQHFGPLHLRSSWIALPPHDEQQRIAEELNEQLSGRLAGISDTARQISLLREYRTRLISDVVTGKLDVRNAARQLPADSELDAPRLDEKLEEAIT